MREALFKSAEMCNEERPVSYISVTLNPQWGCGTHLKHLESQGTANCEEIFTIEVTKED
ncbi:MAG: hypothetical protein H6617_03800 [Bdellovibrionaceae bacterium]|nr:hypothetical protein [Bdellovibrionales bacterium]MCB9253782.1 hypothetical protein [Pseudobdellovibrionaceae bacterium]